MSSLSPVRFIRRMHEHITDVIVRKQTITLTENNVKVKTRISFKADRRLAKEKGYEELYNQLVDHTHKLLHLVINSSLEEDYTYRHHNIFTNDHHTDYGSSVIHIRVTIKAPLRASEEPLKDYEMDDKVSTIVEDVMFQAAKEFVDS